MGIARVASNASSIPPIGTAGTTETGQANAGAVQETDNTQCALTLTDNKQPNENDLQDITERLNDFMQTINTSIQFELHHETTTLMVQVVDSDTCKVIKEVPAHEFLDMVVKIRECIGAFLDEKV